MGKYWMSANLALAKYIANLCNVYELNLARGHLTSNNTDFDLSGGNFE
ncbi:hypothetical protein VIBNIAM115_2030024 [Vibrio nigripulchritudo AM115]|nr:hypothetical protein VIBNIAM115_2030024 [Vibrio nigripulchritudo AM115]